MASFRTKYTPLKHFSKRLAEISQVQDITKDLEKQEVRKLSTKMKFLHASYTIFLIALWQAFWVTLSREAFEFLITSNPDSAFRENLRTEFENTLKRFNTPDAEGVDKLIKAATGISKLSNYWVADGLSNEATKQRLKEILNIRHKIAHTGYSSTPLSYDGNYEHMNFLYSLAGLSSDLIGKHVEELTGKALFGPDVTST
jgi:hypothetical protein